MYRKIERKLQAQRHPAWFRPLMLLVVLGQITWVAADENHGQVSMADERYQKLDMRVPAPAVDGARWYLSFDNDLLSPKNRDQDYTYGINLGYASPEVTSWWPNEALISLDKLLGLSSKNLRGSALEAGLYGFTPSNVESSEPNKLDRPYSSLVYVATSAERMNWEKQVVLRSQFTLGALGLDAVGDVQNLTHRFTGGHEAKGWHNQISNGGEPTFRYSVARMKLLETALPRLELKHTAAASVGYITEASWSISARVGKIATPWHSFKPESKNYAESQGAKRGRSPESYFWIGSAIKLRAYNAFLQGQFRESAVTYSHDELRPVVVEAWVGYAHEFPNGYHLNYGLRGHTSEIKEGEGDRDVIWGGVMIGRRIL
ncbi:hypothetical protein SAMN02745866_00590 [Alteromonadaceae bacterium Bs31]|nr:hypothetical protein SAMN02745866_00590 [Alteromonadaceae bacterium Bs31]